MPVSAAFRHSLLCNPTYFPSTLCVYPFSAKIHLSLKHPLLLTSASSPSSSSSSTDNSSLQSSVHKPNLLRHVSHSNKHEQPDEAVEPSVAAVYSAIRGASSSPVEFELRVEKDLKGGMVLPSADFLRLCVEQLDLFRRIVDPNALLSVYVRPAGGYVMDRLELRRVISHSGESMKDIVLLVGNFHVPTGLRGAEAALSNSQAEVFPEHRAIVFPMVKKPFVVGFLVAELPMEEHSGDLSREEHNLMQYQSPEEAYSLSDGSEMGIRTVNDELPWMFKYSDEQQSRARNITRSLAMAYVMDQKAMLLQQSSWQNNVRMSNLVEQIRGPLSSIRTLSKMLSIHMKRGEIAHDIVEDIMVQEDRIKDTLEELQDAVYLTKANIVRYNQETLKKMHSPIGSYPESVRSQLKDFSVDDPSIVQEQGEPFSLKAAALEFEIPMPPMAIAPLQQNRIRPCNVSNVLGDLVGAIRPLALKQRRGIELKEISHSLSVAIEEPALRQALSNLIEGALLRTRVGGKVEILSTTAPTSGALVFIDDDGPDMHYMTQMHSLTPFGADLSSGDMVEDNMTWNFVAGLTVAREILESYGSVVRVISPRITDAALGTGGTRVELWLPS